MFGQDKLDSDKTIEIIYVKAYKNFKDSTKSSPKIMRNMEYRLLSNSKESRFEYIKSMQSDDDYQTNERFIGRGGGSGVYFKNLKEKIKLHQISGLDESTYLINEELNKFNWQLLKETKKILGYDCFKAVGEIVEYSYTRKKEIHIPIIVWYAPSIPLPFGPAGYDGLPGMVMESQMDSFYLIAKEIKFYDKALKIKRPVKGIKVTQDEFNKALNTFWVKLARQD